MTIRRRSPRVPAPTNEAARRLASEIAPPGTLIPPWLVELVVVAYQNGRYDEACAETLGALE